MKRLLWLGLVVLCGTFVAAPLQAANYKNEYKLSVVPGATSGWGLSASYFADLVKERSQGRNLRVTGKAEVTDAAQASLLDEIVHNPPLRIIIYLIGLLVDIV